MEKLAPARSFGTVLAKGENRESFCFLCTLLHFCLKFLNSEHFSCVAGAPLASLNRDPSAKNDR